MTELNVGVFYRSAGPDSTLRLKVKRMDKECLRWHPDKINNLLAGHDLSEAVRANIAMVARKVIDIRKEFQDKRDS